jgi:wyosine [tRNA(Phe)-imidazoG37] synthetase (radical SAM superfamily)
VKKFIYGPVPSRRLGISLGVDIVPYKNCSYDCIYCQLGRTTKHTIKRSSFVSIDAVLKQIKEVVDQNSDIDYITFSGSGEPTLNRDIGEMIRKVKSFTPIPVAVLTNSSLLWDEKVREDLSSADLVVPSVDAVSEDVLQKVNRPVKGLRISQILEGIKKFCGSYRERIYLEVMLVEGINDTEEEIKRINRFVRGLRVEKIQLNTVIRPPGDPQAKPLTKEELQKIKALFDSDLPVEIIADFDRMTSRAYHEDLEQAVIDLLRRRPTKKDEMATALGVHPNEILKYLQVLEENSKIKRVRIGEESEPYFIIA